jgi:4-amino-4-deoxy-L-arabinose transferase-like glycosyltransferase
MLGSGLRLGAVSHKLAPLYAYWRPHLKGWLAVPAAALAIYFVWLRRTRIGAGLRDGAAAACFASFLVVIAAAVAMLDNGPRSLIGPLLRTDLEYYGAVDRVDGVGRFLRDYADQSTTMPMHAQVHPPGAVLFLWAASRLCGGGPWSAAAAIILTSGLSVLFVFLWARRIGGPGVARRAAAIYVLVPSTVLFTATAMDAVFAVPLIATMWLFWESLSARSCSNDAVSAQPGNRIVGPFGWHAISFGSACPRKAEGMEHMNSNGPTTGNRDHDCGRAIGRSVLLAAAAGLAAGLAALLTYSTVVVIAFCGLAAAAACWTKPSDWRAIVGLAATASAVFVGLQAVLWLAYGYDPLAMFGAAIANANHIMRGTAHETATRYGHLAVGNLAVFSIGVGLPCTVIWCSSLRERRERPAFCGSAVQPFNNAATFSFVAALTLVVATSLPAYTLEVDRVWMFLVPLVVVPVAQRLFDQEHRTGRIGATMAVALLLAAQTLVTEILLTTYW